MILNGLSGCKVEFVNIDESCYVRKTSSSVDYNSRLRSQVQKQTKLNSTSFRCPMIIQEGFVSDLYFVDMEYIGGLNFSDYVDLNHIDDSKTLFNKMLDKIEFGIELQSDKDIIHRKLLSLRDKIEGRNLIFDFLFQNIPEKLPISDTHGDLTFENVIISHDRSIFLIDFLDSFIETPYIDLAKIHQELELFWSMRNKILNTSFVIKYDILRTIFNERLKHVKQQTFIFFTIVNLLRILPYAKTKETLLINQKLDEWEKKL